MPEMLTDVVSVPVKHHISTPSTAMSKIAPANQAIGGTTLRPDSAIGSSASVGRLLKSSSKFMPLTPP